MTTMPRRSLGGGLEVSALGLGCGPMSGLYGAGWGADAASEAAILRGLELGINFFDTADTYGAGHNEMLLGRALRGRRGEAVVATKVGYMRGLDGTELGVCGRPDYIRRACTMSLRRLGVAAIDLYYLHRLDPDVPVEDTVGAMAALVAEGKVRFLGMSEVGPETLRRAHRTHPIAALQSEYSLWTRGPEAAMLPLCRELGIGFVPYSPLGRGFLAGAVRSRADIGADDFRQHIPRFQAENLSQNLALFDRLGQLALECGCTTAQLALAWLLAQDPHIVPIPGTRSAAHLADNAAAAALRLDSAQMAAVAAAVPPEAIAGPRYTPELEGRAGL